METIICKCFAFLLTISTLPFCQKTKTEKDSEKEKLIGVWGAKINENANFEIGKDSIYYFEDKYYKYKIKENSLKNDSIIIYMGGYTYRGVFWIKNDSLNIKDKRSENKFVRIK